MSIKIKLSYTTDEELAGVIRLLSPVIRSWKKARNTKGAYKKAYGEGELERNSREISNRSREEAVRST